jgi:4-hydroxy-3-methylbut-2-enyl diphosphate reductase IspH
VLQNTVENRLQVILAQPRGFCAGVVRAIDIVELALRKYGPPIYVRHEIVHNRHVVESLIAKGAHFVEELSEVPDGAITIFRRMACRERWSTKRATAGCRRSTQPARLSRRCTIRGGTISSAGAH